ncbi:MAG: CPBP family intramembrane metalloprotease [Lachnospiraceae bacterium]|nr:CPBP family intramembrane metalloprotease [Lachnospiraceae bacterium]
MDTESKKEAIRGIIIYLAITFILTYGVEIFLILPLAGSINIKLAYAAQMLITGVMFIPATGALITRLFMKEKLTKENLMFSLNLRGNLKYYGMAWFGVALMIIFGAVLYFLIFPQHFDGDMGYMRAVLEANGQNADILKARQFMYVQVAVGILTAPFLNFVNCFGEEWGWRGYLLPKLQKCFPVVPALLINGLIWGVWHIPLIVMGHNYGTGYRGYPVTGILAMCLFCVVMGIIFSYFTIRTKSCIPAVLAHGMLNGFAAIGIYFTSLEDPYNVFLGPAPTGLIGGAGFIAAACVFLFLLYKEEKQKNGK